MIDFQKIYNKNKDPFYKELQHVKKMYEQDIEKSGYPLVLFTKFKVILNNFQAQEWEECKVYYKRHEANYFSWEEKVIFVLVIDLLKNKILCYNPKIIYEIITAFRNQKVNPFFMAYYLNVFLERDIYQLLNDYLKTDSCYLLSAIMENFISRTMDSNLVTTNYQDLILPITQAANLSYSPIYHGNYDLFDIYRVLKEIMIEESQETLIFSKKEFLMIEQMPYILGELTEIEKNCFLQNLREIEQGFGTRRKLVAKKSLSVIEEFLALAQGEVYLTRKRNMVE